MAELRMPVDSSSSTCASRRVSPNWLLWVVGPCAPGDSLDAFDPELLADGPCSRRRIAVFKNRQCLALLSLAAVKRQHRRALIRTP